ncbi:MAG: hypothetical protein GY714_33045, partial [Desulfobacterales bacterium]|nr:hypothetical protein [Desulfobacterales bacterium]
MNGVIGQPKNKKSKNGKSTNDNKTSGVAYIKPFRYGLILKSKGQTNWKNYYYKNKKYLNKIPDSHFPKFSSTTVKDDTNDLKMELFRDYALSTFKSKHPKMSIDAKPKKYYYYTSPFKKEKLSGTSVKYARLPLNPGWLYVYDGTYMHEYKILKNGKLKKCEGNLKEDVRPTKKRTSTSEYIVVNQSVTMQVAYSEVQWSSHRLSKIIGDKTLRSNRMQPFVIGTEITTGDSHNLFGVKDLKNNFTSIEKRDMPKEWEAKLLRRDNMTNVIAGACCLFDPIGISRDLNENAKIIAAEEILFLTHKNNGYAASMSSTLDNLMKEKNDIEGFINDDKRDKFKEVLLFFKERKESAIKDLDNWNKTYKKEIEEIKKDYFIDEEKIDRAWVHTYIDITESLGSESNFLKQQITDKNGESGFYDAISVNLVRKLSSTVDKSIKYKKEIELLYEKSYFFLKNIIKKENAKSANCVKLLKSFLWIKKINITFKEMPINEIFDKLSHKAKIIPNIKIPMILCNNSPMINSRHLLRRSDF